MRAAVYSKNGQAAEVFRIRDLPVPTVKGGEVLVRVKASGINPIDLKWRSGLRAPPYGEELIPHFDGAGTIEAVGGGVCSSRIGERVWIYEALWQRAQGTAAELCTVPSARAVPLPANIDFAQGACLGIPALTAHRCVFADGPVVGLRVLVTGGAGAVGTAAIRFAKLAGAHVVATVSSPAKAEAASEAGADYVVNYHSQDIAGQIEATGGKIDRIVDVALGLNLPVSADVLADNGTIVGYASDTLPEPTLPFRKLLYRNATVRHVLVFGIPEDAKRQAVADIQTWLANDSFRPRIAAHFGLQQIALAHDAAEKGMIGKVIVDVGS
jgi:NADPH:quinone reductase